MFESQKPTGTTTTVALLAVALVFSPVVLFFSRPVGYVSVSLAVACSVVCASWAWINWKKSSRPAMPSVATQPVKQV